MLLLITERSGFRRDISHTLLQNGMFLFGASFENASFLMREKDIGGVIIDGIPCPDRGALLTNTFREQYPALPIALILSPTPSVNEAASPFLADAWIREKTFDGLISALLRFCRQCGCRTHALQTFDLSLTYAPNETVYMGYPLALSPREHTLLRCLLYRAPYLTSSDDLMSLCYPGEYKSISNLAVLIRNINRRAAKLDPRPLIVNEYKKGYRIREGILE